MANFKTHLTVGIILGIALSILAVFVGLLTNWSGLFLLIALVAVGSFLPDVDSDSAIPFRIVFNLLGVVLAIFTFSWVISIYDEYLFDFIQTFFSFNFTYSRILIALGFSLVVFLFVRFVLGSIFKKITHHRGIFHSLPMNIVVVLLTLFILKVFSSFGFFDRFLFSLGVGIGFLSHLILDEVYATINFSGRKFHPNKNLGSALKLWSSSGRATFLVYLTIFILLKIVF